MLKVLIVDDSFRDRIAIKTALSSDNYEVTEATNFDDALEKLESHTYDIGVFDINLEDKNGNDGLKLAAWVRDNSPFPIILISKHYKDKYYIEKALERAQFLIPKEAADDTDSLNGIIENAIDNFFRPKLTGGQYANYKDRKIGLRHNNIYHFYGKDDIYYLRGDGDTTRFYLKNRKKPIILSRNLGHFVKQIEPTFPNFIRLGKSYFVNVEKIATFWKNTL